MFIADFEKDDVVVGGFPISNFYQSFVIYSFSLALSASVSYWQVSFHLN
jgi:hypothetical protein